MAGNGFYSNTIYSFIKQATSNRLHPSHESLGGLEVYWFPITLLSPDIWKKGLLNNAAIVIVNMTSASYRFNLCFLKM